MLAFKINELKPLDDTSWGNTHPSLIYSFGKLGLPAVLAGFVLIGHLAATFPAIAAESRETSARPRSLVLSDGRFVVARNVSVRPRLNTSGIRPRAAQSDEQGAPENQTAQLATNEASGDQAGVGEAPAGREATPSISVNARSTIAPSVVRNAGEKSEPVEAQPSADPVKPGSPLCLAGCTVADGQAGRSRAALAAATSSYEPVQALTNNEVRTSNCFAGCYGTMMETTADKVQQLTGGAEQSSSRERSSITVLRGNSRKRVYPNLN